MTPRGIVGIGKELLNGLGAAAAGRDPVDGRFQQLPATIRLQALGIASGMPLHAIERRGELHEQAADREKPLIGKVIGKVFGRAFAHLIARSPAGPPERENTTRNSARIRSGDGLGKLGQTKDSAVSAGAGPYLSGAIVKLARPWLTLRTAAE